MKQQGTLDIETSNTLELMDITTQINRAVGASGCESGICFLYNPHTTSALTINEGTDPAVQEDIIAALQKIVPAGVRYKHLEGNSPAHVMTSIVGSSEMVIFENGTLKLGTWQRIFFCEFDGPRKRKIHWRILSA
jgi:secondary thiamine-phosphate synthase enzyme